MDVLHSITREIPVRINLIYFPVIWYFYLNQLKLTLVVDAKRIFLFLKVLLLSFFLVALSKYFARLSVVDLLLILLIFKGALKLLCYNFAKLFAIGDETRIESILKT